MSSPGKKNSGSVSGSYHARLIQASVQDCSGTADLNDLSTVLFRAAMIGDSLALGVLLDRGADVNFRDEQGRTVLVEAVFGGHLDAVNLLIARGADVNASDRNGWTALMEASSKGFYEIAKVLTSNGADPERRNKQGGTALKSVAKRHLKLARLLSDTGASK